MSGRMQAVELVERDSPGPGAEPASAAPPVGGWLRRNARWLAPVAAVAVGGLLLTQTAVDRRERDRLAALASVPGVLAPVGDGLDVRWRGGPQMTETLQGAVLVAGTLVGAAETARRTGRTAGTLDLTGRDPDTGTLRWTTTVGLPTPLATPDGVSPQAWTTCWPVGPPAQPAVGCLAQQPGTATVTPDLSLWLLAPSTGTLLRALVLPGGSGVTVSQGRLVTAVPRTAALDQDPDRGTLRWQVTATDLDGGTAWTFTTPPVDVVGREDGVATVATSTGSAALDARGERVVLTVDEHAWVLDADGTLQRTVALADASWLELDRAGGLVQTTYDGAGGRYALLLDDGREVDVPAVPLWLAVDDGSAPGLVLLADRTAAGTTTVEARDVRSADVVWQVTTHATAALVLGGRLYLGGPDGLRSLDVATGRQVWRVDVEGFVDSLATDGRSLVVPGLGPRATGYALTDGRQLWSTALLPLVSGSDRWAGERLVVGSRAQRLYVALTDGTVAVLG